ncbi:MAG TPA: hypothetical protein VF191_03730 [Cyclobacteriaceae bacterium]
MAVKLRKTGKIAVWVLAGAALIAAFFLVQRNRVALLERMLVQFVDSRTNGQYHLVVEETGFDLPSLTYHVRNITITANDTTSSGPIREIRIPFAHARMQSLASLLSRELHFSEVTVAEPTIVLAATGRLDSKHITVGQAMVTVFPAVESVLKYLGIETLRIVRATLSIEESTDHVTHVRLIDLIAEHWNEHSEGEGDVRLEIGGQSVALSHASFSFTEVDYAYSRETLEFKDFNFESYDTVSQSQISVQGKSVLIRRLDFGELYNNQRYRFDKIEITEPKFSGSLRARTRPRPDDRIRLPLSAILTQTFGEIRLDTATINDASFEMVLVFDQDSVKAQIPDVNISLHNVEVLSDTTDIIFGDLQMDLTQTDINLNNDVRLSCNTMLFERNEDITISNVNLTGASGERFVSCERIGFKNFRLFEFLAGRELSADSIAIGNATIHVTRDLPGLFPSFTSTRSTRDQRPVRIRALSLRNVDLNYENASQQLSIGSLDANASDITDLSWRSMAQQLRSVGIGTLTWRDERKNVHSSLRNFRLTTDRASIAVGSATIDSLTIDVSGLSVARPLPFLLQGDFRHWGFVTTRDLRIGGYIPTAAARSFSVRQFAIDRLEADVRLGDMHFSGHMRNLVGHNITHDTPQRLEGTLSGLRFVSRETQLEADSIALNTEGLSKFYNLRITNEATDVATSYAETSGLSWVSGNRNIERLFVRQLQLDQGSWVVNTDSAMLSGIDLEPGRPSVRHAEVYSPVLYRDQGEGGSPSTAEPLELPRVSELILHDGQVNTPDRQFNLTGTSRILLEDNIAMEFEQLSFTLANHDVDLHDFRIEGNSAHAGLMKARPRPLAPDAHETDVITGEWQSLKATGLMVDELIETERIIADTITVSGLVLDVTRDKRLSDPDPTEKDFAISDLISNSGIDADVIRLRESRIKYSELSETNGEEGSIWFADLDAEIRSPHEEVFEFDARAQVYDHAPIAVNYEKVNASTFRMKVDVGGMDLTALNRVLRPLQSLELKSGYLDRFRFEATATRDTARGHADMSYKNLHMTLLNKTDPDKKWLGQDIVSFLANGVLKHNREDARADVEEIRIPEKSVFNYWKRIAVNGALNVVKKGKKTRR